MKIQKIITLSLVISNLLCAERFIKEGEIVYDNKTKLSWQRNPSSERISVNNAKKYCTNLDYGGKNDWRLPNQYELVSLIDYKKYNPAISTELINIINGYYWSSSFDKRNTLYPYIVVSFQDGIDAGAGKDYNEYVLCVR